MKIKNIFTKERIRQHLTDSTAIILESTPIFAALETCLVGMSSNVSMNARLCAAGLGYAGLGFVYGKGRDVWRKMLRVTQESKERYQAFSDLTYPIVFNSIAGPLVYYFSGARNLKEIVWGTGAGIVLGAANGWFIGYAIDTFRDLTGFKECTRSSYPAIVKRQSQKIKAGLAALLVAGSLGLTSELYSINNSKQLKEQPIQVERMSETKDITTYLNN